MKGRSVQASDDLVFSWLFQEMTTNAASRMIHCVTDPCWHGPQLTPWEGECLCPCPCLRAGSRCGRWVIVHRSFMKVKNGTWELSKFFRKMRPWTTDWFCSRHVDRTDVRHALQWAADSRRAVMDGTVLPLLCHWRMSCMLSHGADTSEAGFFPKAWW